MYIYIYVNIYMSIQYVSMLKNSVIRIRLTVMCPLSVLNWLQIYQGN